MSHVAHLYIPDMDDMVKTNPECPNAAAHDLHPRGYVAHHMWMRERIKTHRVSRCPDCGLFVIYTPRVAPAQV